MRPFPLIFFTTIFVFLILITFLPLQNSTKILIQTVQKRNRQTNNSLQYPYSLPNIYYEVKILCPKTQKCGRFPLLLDLKFSNNWQIEKTYQGTFHLFSAYLDDRQSNVVQIIGMLNNMNPRGFYCQLWYNANDVEFVRSSFYWIWRKNWNTDRNFYQPYLVSCKIPDGRIPMSVSLVERKCDMASNNLKIYYEKVDRKGGFVVCVKGLNFPEKDISVKLVEWLELVRILGADRVHFYQFNTNHDIHKVLDYYTLRGFVDVTPLSLVGPFSNLPRIQNKFLTEQTTKRRLQEVIPFNDCLYRYLYKFQYIVSLDIDEVIVPQRGTWFDLLADLYEEKGVKSDYLARNVYFFDQFETKFEEVPEYMHFMRHVTRSREYSNENEFVKGFHNTDQVLALYNHIALWCFKWFGCDNYNIDIDWAQLQHYRNGCVKEVQNCEELKRNVVVDTRLWRFLEVLVPRVKKVLTDLGFFNN